MTNMMLFIFWLLLIIAVLTAFYTWRKHRQIKQAAEQREKAMLQALLAKKIKKEDSSSDKTPELSQ
ncbi:hypothetical protein [Thioflexithrix psekupsensis]|uniref:DUF2897 domain-containing protein n=1 Tax=Thioflexithrix psekupsensis TaxID=1570016 RepID=A0A251X8I5_9GAMM|nr:hypothetical protein [Thioflexithrix psekupsensis]OUD14240.1 hypothetical protein TPSD3_07885 [Thioflexithrix psekupsensis]